MPRLTFTSTPDVNNDTVQRPGRINQANDLPALQTLASISCSAASAKCSAVSPRPMGRSSWPVCCLSTRIGTSTISSRRIPGRLRPQSDHRYRAALGDQDGSHVAESGYLASEPAARGRRPAHQLPRSGFPVRCSRTAWTISDRRSALHGTRSPPAKPPSARTTASPTTG